MDGTDHRLQINHPTDGFLQQVTLLTAPSRPRARRQAGIWVLGVSHFTSLQWSPTPSHARPRRPPSRSARCTPPASPPRRPRPPRAARPRLPPLRRLVVPLWMDDDEWMSHMLILVDFREGPPPPSQARFWFLNPVLSNSRWSSSPS
jgi:hypothetical protein